MQGEAQPAAESGDAEKVNSDAKESAPEEKVGSRDFTANVLVPEASGTEVYGTEEISLDVSNASEGYIMLNYNGSNEKVKLQIQTPEGATYTYSIMEYGTYKAYPLSGGNGTYVISVFEAASVEENMYAVAATQELDVSITDELQPFLYPNYYVDFNASSACVKQGEELAKSADSDLDVVASVYDFIIKNIVYDHDKAATVQSGYAPYPDDTLSSKKGICFDYASLTSAMLRSQKIPTRLEVGYVGELYHAWISCYIDEKGWVDDVIEFDGTGWTMMDPTTAAGAGSKEVLKMQEETGYAIKYIY